MRLDSVMMKERLGHKFTTYQVVDCLMVRISGTIITNVRDWRDMCGLSRLPQATFDNALRLFRHQRYIRHLLSGTIFMQFPLRGTDTEMDSLSHDTFYLPVGTL